MFASHSSGRFTTAQPDFVLKPAVDIGYPIIVYGHGAGGDAGEAGGGSLLSAVPPILQALARAGFPVVVPTMTATWGNATTDSRVADAITYGRALVNDGARAVAAVGSSHGTTCLLDYGVDHDLRFGIFILPAVNLTEIRDGNLSGLQASINTAHGTTGTNPLPAGADPTLNAMPDYPLQMWGSTDDAICLPASTTAYVAASGAEFHSLGATGHTNAAIAAVDIPALVAFAVANR